MRRPASGASMPGHARSFNRRLVLETVRLEGPISRASVARNTGLSIQTISNIADELLHAGLLLEGALPREGRGAPAAGLALNPDGGFTFGISLDHRNLDIG